MIYCDSCGVIIDSDDDPACFVKDNSYYETKAEILCEACRAIFVREDMKMSERGAEK